MLVTRGLGPAPTLPSGGFGPIGVVTGPPRGRAAGGYGWLSAADGHFDPRGGSVGDYGWAGAATGITPIIVIPHGGAAGVYGWIGSAVGKKRPRGAAEGIYGWTTIALSGRFRAGIMVLHDTETGRIIIIDC